MGTYTFTSFDGEVLGKADEELNPVGESFELLNRIPRNLTFGYGTHRGDNYTERSTEIAVGQPGYGPALQDWLLNEDVKLDYER